MNTWSWLAWLFCGLVFISATRNPLYLILVLVALNILFLTYSNPSSGEGTMVVSPLKLSLLIAGMSTLFNALTSHVGETILFTIPGRLPLFSGPVTLEAAIYGFTNGLVLVGILTAFLIINIVLPISALIRLVPRAFYPLAIVVSIAVTFLPATRRRIDQVLEAQAIRGHRIRGLGDWMPLLMPLLIGGLESSIQLAETMTGRGFISNNAGLKVPTRPAMFGGLLLAAGGWLARLLGMRDLPGTVLLVGGATLILWALWQTGRQMPRTSYQREPWRFQDFLIIGGYCGLIFLALFGYADTIQATLNYQPYPQAALPSFELGIGLLIQTLLIPAFITRKAGDDSI